MTDYAEGELFQILEDDGQLPEEQVFCCLYIKVNFHLHTYTHPNQILMPCATILFFHLILGTINSLSTGVSPVSPTFTQNFTQRYETSEYIAGERRCREAV